MPKASRTLRVSCWAGPVICPICRNGTTEPGTTTVTLERGELTFISTQVPARVCDNCGEDYVDESTTRRLIDLAEEAAAAGVKVEIRTFHAA